MKIKESIFPKNFNFFDSVDNNTVAEVIDWLSTLPQDALFDVQADWESRWIELVKEREETPQEEEIRKLKEECNAVHNKIRSLEKGIEKLEFQKIFYVTRYQENDWAEQVANLQRQIDEFTAIVESDKQYLSRLKDKIGETKWISMTKS